MPFLPRDAPAKFRNAIVQAVSGRSVTVLMDGATVAGIDTQGAVQVGQKVLVLVQGNSMTVVPTTPDFIDTVENTSVSWNACTQPGRHPRLMNGTYNPNGPGVGMYYYLENYCYSESSGNLTQVAVPYYATGSWSPWMRARDSGAWSGWSAVGPSGGGALTTGGQSAGAGAATTISTWYTSLAVSGAVATADSGGITLSQGGWWSFQASMSGWGFTGTPRQFITIWVAGGSHRTAVSGGGENVGTAHVTCHAVAGSRVTVDVYSSAGGFNVSGDFWFKYLGS